MAALAYSVAMAVTAFFFLGFGRPSANLLVGGALGYAVVGLLVAAIFRPSRPAFYVLILVLCSVMMRVLAVLPSVREIDAGVVMRLVLEQVVLSGVSAAFAFWVSGAYWQGREASGTKGRPLYRE